MLRRKLLPALMGILLFVALAAGFIPIAKAAPCAAKKTAALLSELDANPLKAPPFLDHPTDVKLGINLLDINDVSGANGTYSTIGYIYLTWKDPRLVFQSSGSNKDFFGPKARHLLDDVIWWPDLEFVNEAAPRQRSQQHLTIAPDGTAHYEERFNVTISASLDFKRFPYDKQTLPLAIESFSGNKNVVRFSIDRKVEGQQNINMPEWILQSMHSGIQEYDYHDGYPAYSRYQLMTEVQRTPGFYTWKIFVPMYIIMLITWIMLWSRDLSDEVEVLNTTLLTITAYLFVVVPLLPHVSYLTFIDAFVTLCFFFVFLRIGLGIRLDLHEHEKGEKGGRMRRLVRVFYPLAFILSNWALALAFR